jgi:two-component system chemotaxis sensor kinase CheA
MEQVGGRSAIENIQGTAVFRLRGQLLPVVSLREAFGHPVDPARAETALNIIVLQADDRQFGLVVDEVRDTEEIVVKPLGKELKAVAVFAGATIMGDGRVALILDVLGLGLHAGALSRTRGSRSPLDEARKPVAGPAPDPSELKQSLLLFNAREDATLALPLAMVARLEEFPRSSFERASTGSVVQYRGAILPLIELCDQTGGADGESLPVIVYSEGDNSIGFVVGRILDVVDEVIRVERRGAHSGVLGAAIVQGKVTEVVDVQDLIRSHAPWFFSEVVR